jgi:hypothetical protein
LNDLAEDNPRKSLPFIARSPKPRPLRIFCIEAVATPEDEGMGAGAGPLSSPPSPPHAVRRKLKIAATIIAFLFQRMVHLQAKDEL